MTDQLSWSQLCVLVASLVLPVSCEDGPSFCFQNDPCQTALHTLDVYGRATDCPIYGEYGQCDSSLTDRWYRVDVPMVTTCPDIGRCGTYYPVWLNGTLPTSGMVTRTACKHGFVSCCEVAYTIVLKKCTTFMAYCLQHTTGCAERYCFGTSGSCPVATISTAPVTPTSVSTGAGMPTSSSSDITVSIEDDGPSPGTLSQLPTTSSTSATTETTTATTPTNTNPGDTPSFSAALVVGIVCGVLAFAVICVIIGVLWKRQKERARVTYTEDEIVRAPEQDSRRDSENPGGDNGKSIRKGDDQNPYSEIRDIVSERSQYTDLNLATIEPVYTYSQPKQVVDEQARNRYEDLGSRNPVPQYDPVNTDVSPMSATTTRNKNEDQGLQNHIPIYDEINTGGTSFTMIVDSKS